MTEGLVHGGDEEVCGWRARLARRMGGDGSGTTADGVEEARRAGGESEAGRAHGVGMTYGRRCRGRGAWVASEAG